MMGRASLRLRVELMVWLTLASVSSRRALRRDCSKSQVLWITLAACTASSSSNSWSASAEGLLPVGVHIEHPAHLAQDLQRHGQFGADLGAQA